MATIVHPLLSIDENTALNTTLTNANAAMTTAVSAVAATIVTFGNLNSNGDVGTGADQVAAGDHTHAALYVPLTASVYTSATAVTLTDAANIAWNLATGGFATVTLADTRVLDNPTNMVAGGHYTLIVKQDGTGSRLLTYGTAYKFAGGTAPTLSTAASSIDILTFVSDGTSMYHIATVKALATPA